MKSPKISIITPSYNQGQFIEETILSVINQTYPNLEYIIIDGGSTDNTVDIIKKYEHQVAYWVSEKDDGQSEAINKGFKKATGDIVSWINSDDILMPDALNKVVSYFERDKDLDFINGFTLLIDKNSNILSSHIILKQKRWYAKRGIYYVNQPSMFWKRDIFNSIGFLKEDFHSQMDKELLIRIFQKKFKIGHTKKFLAAFRIHEMAKSSSPMDVCLRDSAELYKLYGKKYGQNPKLFFKVIYRLEKFFKGIYFKKWSFAKRWKGKHVVELNKSNCVYLK